MAEAQAGGAPEPGEATSTPYVPPLPDILLALETVGLGELLALEDFAHLQVDDVEFALREFGRLASEVIAPTDRIGDIVGVHLGPENEVRTPAPFHDAYRRYVDGGWGSLPFPEAYGGGNFPRVVAMAEQEMFASANLSLSLNPVLTQGAVEVLLAFGNEAQRATYLAKMVSGEWTGTMALTEADAGSDLGNVRTVAERGEGGRWRVTGTKIFTTWGEHDLAENIVHMVLGRIPGAPEGTRGLSAFLVPKLLPHGDGSLSRNSLQCVHLERKLGIHASPTCVMEFDGAIGELVGEENDGLRTMFTMMNAERLSIGLEGPAIGERAFQQAYAYASERLQGRANSTSEGHSPIIEHPDVARMLLEMRTRVLASRLLVYRAAAYGDLAHHAPNPAVCARAQSLIDLLTPIAKAWGTDVGCTAASLGVQVLGGAGFIEETGMAQRLRDARITPIYEGTNGIQAIDLVTRKLPRDGARAIHLVIEEISATLKQYGAEEDGALAPSYEILADVLGILEEATAWMLRCLSAGALDDALSGATSYLELAGVAIGGWLMLRRAEIGAERQHSLAVIEESNFFASEVAARATGLLRPITSGHRRLSALRRAVRKITRE